MHIDYTTYPDNYDFLPEEEYNSILEYLNGPDDPAERFNEERRKYASELEQRGIAARWNWPSSRRMWILATYSDAEFYDDWLIQTAD